MTAPPHLNKDGTPDRRTKNGKGTYPSKAERDERAAKALTMRNAGATFQRIGDQLGISEQMARNDVSRAIKEWVRVPAEQMVDRQRAILNDIVRVEYSAAMDPSSPRHYQAQAKILEALEHEAKLHGLYAPQKVSLGISEQEFARQAAELLKVTGPAPLLELAATEVVEAEVVEAVEDDEEPWSNL
jgi:hypothetical protein